MKTIACLHLHVIAFLLIPFANAAFSETLADYAQTCDAHVGASIPAFSCLDGAVLPMQGPEGGPCDYPTMLNGKCHAYSRTGQLKTSNPLVDIHFLCRHYKRATGPQDPIFNDIAVIQTNYATGATCFFQTASGDHIERNGAAVPSPRSGDTRFWLDPHTTAAQGCVSCHDNGPFIRSPFILQADPGHNVTNRRSPYYYFPGKDFAHWQVNTVDLKQANGCTRCHIMGLSNVRREFATGSIMDLGMKLAGLKAIPNALSRSVQMGRVDNGLHEEAMKEIAACVTNPTAECQIFPRASGLFRREHKNLNWEIVPPDVMYVSEGSVIPTLQLRAVSNTGAPIKYLVGSPHNECSWDRPAMATDGGRTYLHIDGQVPERNQKFTIAGRPIRGNNDECFVEAIADDGSKQISRMIKFVIANSAIDRELEWDFVGEEMQPYMRGSQIRPLIYRARSKSGERITYTHGHPDSECNWDVPKDEGSYLSLKGAIPASGTFTISGNQLQSGTNICNVEIVAKTGTEQISQIVTFYID